MFGTIRRHQNWLWAIIITVIIVSFVIFFSPYSRMNGSGGGRRPSNLGSINGERITPSQWQDALRDVNLRFFFFIGNGHFPDEESKKTTGFDPERETYQWLLLLQKAEQMGIHVSVEDAAQFAHRLTAQFEREGLTPATFVERVLQPHGLTMEDFERFCRNQLCFEELMYAVGLSGKLVTPEEVKALYIRNHEEVSSEGVFFSVSNYIANVTATPEAISMFYSNRMANYRIPDRVQLAYVLFNVSNYLGQAETDLKTNLAQSVDGAMQQLGTNYTQFGKTPDEAKAKVREEIIRREALNDARKKASEFAVLLDTDKPKPDDLEAAAKTNHLTVKISEPFERTYGPTNMEVGADFVKAAFSLTLDQPFTMPLVGRDGAYVIGYHKVLPSELQTLDQVRDRVTHDYKFIQALQTAYTSGQAFHSALTNGLAQGKTFASICQNSQLKPVSLPPFSIGTRDLPDVEDRATINDLKQAAFSTLPGRVSQFVWPETQNLQRLPNPGGFILFVRAKLPVDQAKMAADLPAFTQTVRQRRMQEAFNLWFQKEAQKGLLDTPLLQRQSTVGASAAKS